MAFQSVLSEVWQFGVSTVIVSLCVLFSLRQILGWRALRRLRRLARHSHAIQRCFDLVARVHPPQLPPHIHHALSKILWHHLNGAGKQRPGHPYLSAQAMQIARFAGLKTPAPGRVERPNADTLAALYELQDVLGEGLEDAAITTVEHFRAASALSAWAASLETELLKRKAQSAEHLRRDAEALAYLRSAWQSAAGMPDGGEERRRLASRIGSLESA